MIKRNNNADIIIFSVLLLIVLLIIKCFDLSSELKEKDNTLILLNENNSTNQIVKKCNIVKNKIDNDLIVLLNDGENSYIAINAYSNQLNAELNYYKLFCNDRN